MINFICKKAIIYFLIFYVFCIISYIKDLYANSYNFENFLYNNKLVGDIHSVDNLKNVYQLPGLGIDINTAGIADIADNKCAKLYVVLPSNVVVGRPARITVQAWDWADRISINAKNTIYFSSTDDSAILPKNFTFNKNDRGVKTIEKVVTFYKEGIHYISVEDKENKLWAVSNPVIVTAIEPEYKWYWGDLHFHTINSDGAGSLEWNYKYAKDINILDFASSTEHDVCWENVGDFWQTPYMKAVGWDIVKKAVNKFNEDGRFVTLLAYEYTHDFESKGKYGDGHYCVYYNTVDDAPFYSNLDEKSDRIFKLWQLLKDWKNMSGFDVFTVPHHLIDPRLGWNSDYYDPEMVPLVEVYQGRGSSEMRNEDGNPIRFTGPYGELTEKGHSVQDALSMGYRMGLIAGTDGHEGHPGRIPYKSSFLTEPQAYIGPFGIVSAVGKLVVSSENLGGITGVYAKNLTRQDIFDALKNRRVVAITDANRMIIDFTINGKSIIDGSTILIDNEDEPRNIKVSVAGTAPIKSITIVKNNKDFYSYLGKGSDIHNFDNYKATFSITDSDEIKGINYDDKRGNEGLDFYYIRVLQANERGAGWLGPIWVGCKK